MSEILTCGPYAQLSSEYYTMDQVSALIDAALGVPTTPETPARCEYCDSRTESGVSNCRNCGART